MWTAAELLLAFVVLYPVCTAAMWIAGGAPLPSARRAGRGRGARRRVAGGVRADPRLQRGGGDRDQRLGGGRSDYPQLEVLVLDDGSTDATEAAALEAIAGDPRCRVIRDPVNRGKAEQLNAGFAQARYELVAVTDADTHMHPAGAQAARRAHVPLAPRRRGRGCAARHQPWPLSACDAGAGGGVDHRPDPPHASP